MSTFTFDAAYGSAVAQEPRVRRLSFGDGYEQRASFGINLQPRVWTLLFAAKDADDSEDIIEFLQDRRGVEHFDWQPPVGLIGKWICRSWNQTIVSNGISNIDATFEEVFES